MKNIIKKRENKKIQNRRGQVVPRIKERSKKKPNNKDLIQQLPNSQQSEKVKLLNSFTPFNHMDTQNLTPSQTSSSDDTSPSKKNLFPSSHIAHRIASYVEFHNNFQLSRLTSPK